MAGRIVDVVGATALLIMTSPLLVAGAIAVKVDSRGPVIYQGVRVGRDGRPFRILKLRTMAWQPESVGASITAGDDPRLTRVGRFLRRIKVDELPQFINVVKGDMSLVGPRPEDPEWVQTYSAEQRRLLAVRPGLTSPASLEYIDEKRLLQGRDWRTWYRDVILPAKLSIELAYLDRRTPWSDIVVLGMTAWPWRRSRKPSAPGG